MSATFGFIFKIYGPINMKIGGGYGNNSMWVRLHNGSAHVGDFWVSDVSAYGFSGVLGVQAHLGKLVLSLDGATTNFNIFEARLGIGMGVKGK